MGTMLTLPIGLGLATAARVAPPERPAITGISHLAVTASDAAKSEDYYVRVLGAMKAADPEDPKGVRYYFSPSQFVEVLPAPDNVGISHLAHVAWNTANAAALRAFLLARHYPGISAIYRAPDGSLWFRTKDPEGNEVQFVQPVTVDRTPFAGGDQWACHPCWVRGARSGQAGWLLSRSARLPATLVGCQKRAID